MMNPPLRILYIGDGDGFRALAGLGRELSLPWSLDHAGDLAAARRALAKTACEVVATEFSLGAGTAFDLFPDPEAVGDRSVILLAGPGDEAAVRALRAGFADCVVKRPAHAHLRELAARAGEAGARRRRDREARETAARLSDLFDGTSEIIQSVTPEGRLEYANRAWRETFGYREEEIAGMSLFNLIHPDCQAHCGMLFQRLMAGEDIGEIEATFVTRDGRSVVLQGRATVRFENGRPVATRTVLRDVTEKRAAAERELRQRELTLRLQSGLLLLRERNEGELQGYLGLVTATTRDALQLGSAAVWLPEPGGDQLTCRSHHPADADGPAPGVDAQAEAAGRLLAALGGDSPVTSDDLAATPELAGLADAGVVPAGTTGIAVAPLVIDGRPRGFVALTHARTGAPLGTRGGEIRGLRGRLRGAGPRT